MWGVGVRFQGSSQIHLGRSYLGAANPIASFVPFAFCASVILGVFAKQIKPENSPCLAGICSLFSKLLCYSSNGLEIPQLQFYGAVSRCIRYLGSYCSIGQRESPESGKSTFLVPFVPYATI